MKDLDQFQGAWQAVGLEENGRQRPAAEVRGARLTVSGNRYTLDLRGRHFQGLITRIDPTRRPGEVNFFGIEGRGSVDKRFLGIYRLEDGALAVCLAPPGKHRPTTFEPGPGSSYSLCVLGRVGRGLPEGEGDAEYGKGGQPAAAPSEVSPAGEGSVSTGGAPGTWQPQVPQPNQEDVMGQPDKAGEIGEEFGEVLRKVPWCGGDEPDQPAPAAAQADPQRTVEYGKSYVGEDAGSPSPAAAFDGELEAIPADADHVCCF